MAETMSSAELVRLITERGGDSRKWDWRGFIAEADKAFSELEAKASEHQGAVTIYQYAADHAIKRAEKAEAERDAYRSSLETLCVLLDDACNGISLARAVALSHFGAEGLSMADVRKRFEESIR